MLRRTLLSTPALLAAKTGQPDLDAKVARAALALQRHSWEHGILAQAFLELDDHETLLLLTHAAVLEKDKDGRLAAIGGGVTDPAMGGAAYLAAANRSGNSELKSAVQVQLDFLLTKSPRAADGTLFHVAGAPEMWSDSYFTTPPFLAAAGRFDEALLQIDGLKKRLWNPEKRLFSHIWDDGARRFKRQALWGVGNGWAAAGITKVLEALPANRAQDKARLTALLEDLLQGCLALQRPDGLFHDVLDQPSTFVETNLAQMLAYAIYTGLRRGWLPAKYRPAADRMRAAARAKVDTLGFVQGVCGAPHFDRPGIATEGQAFFLMMEAAARRLRA